MGLTRVSPPPTALAPPSLAMATTEHHQELVHTTRMVREEEIDHQIGLRGPIHHPLIRTTLHRIGNTSAVFYMKR